MDFVINSYTLRKESGEKIEEMGPFLLPQPVILIS